MAVYEAEVTAEVVYVVNVTGKTKAEAEQRAKEAFAAETLTHVIKFRGVSLRKFGQTGGHEALEISLCDDCPPEDYPTDKTRCNECPRFARNQ